MNRLCFICVTAMMVAATCASALQKHTVTYLQVLNVPSPEDTAAVSWLRTQPMFEVRVVSLAGKSVNLGRSEIIWIHLPDSARLTTLLSNKQAMAGVRRLYRNGGKLLLTDYSAMLPYRMGIEPKRPELRVDTVKDDWLFDKRGFQGFRGHPIFSGLNGGEYVWDPDRDQVLPFIGYFGDKFPESGKVVAVDRAYVFIYGDRKVAFEYSQKKGKILAFGSCIYFGRPNHLRRNLEKVIGNSLLYLAGELLSGPKTYWEKFENVPRRFSVESAPLRRSDSRTMRSPPATELCIRMDRPQNNFFDVAGRRALFMGKENAGIDEVWVHPFRVLRDYAAGIVSGDSVAWLSGMPVRIEVRPESFTRVYAIPGGELRETICASLSKAGGIIHYSASVNSPLVLVVRFRSDLRWMWPYDANALGDIHYAYDDGLDALHICDTTRSFYSLCGGDLAPRASLSGHFSSVDWKRYGLTGTATDLNQISHASVFVLDSSNDHALTYAIVGTNEGREKAEEAYRSLLEDPAACYSEVVDHYNTLLTTKLTIESPDSEFNALFKWALVGTDRFLAFTPGVGTGLLAGYSTTARGWNGGHMNSGRPGYAWYFGRDSEWSGFAIDDYGDFSLVKKQLGLLQRYQDGYGKIFHEISTSGVVNYDAADATPLYIVLAGHYLRASGDTAFIRDSWPFLKKAVDFLYSTDTDGDGLIENTNVGHGWVEGGALFGAHSTFYLTSCWAQVLKDMSMIAALLAKDDLAQKYSEDERKVENILNKDFWNDSTQFYNLGKMKNGTYQTEPTVLPAVGAYFNLLDEEKVGKMLEAFAGNGFSSDWGVRIVGSSSRLFSPTGYHYGSIWPLFTGWTALAEYQYGNSTQAFMHLSDNLHIKKYWALGFVEEVMHGAVYEPSGVCPHQCWSETNVLHPAITGMVGWKPDAVHRSVTLQPRFPVSWSAVTVHNMRIGNSVLRMNMLRDTATTVYRFALIQGNEVAVNFSPELPEGMIIKEAMINGVPLPVSPVRMRHLLGEPIKFMLKDSVTVVLKHEGGVGMYPVIPSPQPGDSSAGYRIISSSLVGNQYSVTLEGRAGSTHRFELKKFAEDVERVQNATVEPSAKSDPVSLRVDFEPSPERFGRKTVTVILK